MEERPRAAADHRNLRGSCAARSPPAPPPGARLSVEARDGLADARHRRRRHEARRLARDPPGPFEAFELYVGALFGQHEAEEQR